jgi:hypothetical protein
MPDRDQQPDLDYLRELAARDPLSYQLYVRALRSERIRAMMSALLRFVWRHIKQTPRAFATRRATDETKPAFMACLASMFGRRKRASVESYPLTSATKALIANLMAMR